jgi:phosphoglycolate phosphatase
MTPGRLSVLVCDLDGTLVDSAADLANALNRILAEEGRRELRHEEVKMMVGDGVAKLIEKGFLGTGAAISPNKMEDTLKRFLKYYDSALTVETKPYPRVRETLTALKSAGWRLAKPAHPSRRILQDLNLDHLFEAVAGGDSFKVRKPDPGHLTSLLDAMSAKVASAVMLGDSANDVLTARRAGVPSLLVDSGYGGVPAAELGADAIIEDYDQLPAALRALEGVRPDGPGPA